MPLYTVQFVKSAKKEFDRLSARVQEQVIDALTVLAQNPWTELLQIKKLKGEDSLYRVRLGDYRLVYKVEKRISVVLVVKIGHRKDVYRGR